ncbi:MAG: hypothetical protein ACI80V_001607 [Rhodothermales bacterium]|jgi:hypothetical protein
MTYRLVFLLAVAGCGPASPLPVEQTSHGSGPAPVLVASFDGLGVGFDGPQGPAATRNPSDNSLAVGPDHVIQTVNTRMAIFDRTGQVLYGAAEIRNVFRGFGGPCEEFNNGDTVVRYDQLADRWLVVMPIFRRLPRRADEPPTPTSADGVVVSQVGNPDQPGPAVRLHIPTRPTPQEISVAEEARRLARQQPRGDGSYAMCYAISTSSDPFGTWHRYEFVRPLFPDYPRPAVWPDGYYVPTSTGDNVIEKHACVVDRSAMLKGEPASEQCIIVDDVNFLNNADLDGRQLPPPGAPNIMLATGGSQLTGVTRDSTVLAWNYHVDWDDPSKTHLTGPTHVPVEPYDFLCGGQLTECVPQPGVDQRIDSQGDKIMARLVYRRIGRQESVVGVHSVATTLGTGGVRWYEFRVGADRAIDLHQQGTLAPDSSYRWMASPAMDGFGNIGIGYSFGSATQFPGQRFAGRTPEDPLGRLGLREAVLVDGEASQTTTLRWEDYTQTAVDPVDDCTIWYVGDYLKEGATLYSTRIGAYRLPGCGQGE